MTEEKSQDGLVPSEAKKNMELIDWKTVISNNFAKWNRLRYKDMNNRPRSPVFRLFTKDKILDFLSNPARSEKELRDAVIYIYGASSHFRRLIQYFVSLSDLSYIVEPYRIDPQTANKRMVNINYRKVLDVLSAMSIKTQLPKILTVCLREDVCYCTMWVTRDNITIQRLPSDYCTIETVEGNVPNVTFNFAYFDTRRELLPYYPVEFERKYDLYRNKKTGQWIELDSPTSFAIKCNTDILEYAIPPFAGILGELYDIEEYKQIELAKAALENYAMLSMLIPMTESGEWGIDLPKAKEFWQNLDSVLPEEIGSVLTPMPIQKISFEKAHNTENDTISNAEQNMFTAAGVSSLIFNNEKASANALILSMKADQAITYGIVKSIQDAINRFIQTYSYGKHFKVNFLDVSFVNRKEVGDAYLKAASYGLPTISAYAASQGIGQAELDTMSYLEGEVLELHKLFKPLQSSTQMSSSDINESVDNNVATEDGGAPQKDASELSDSGEQSREDNDGDW